MLTKPYADIKVEGIGGKLRNENAYATCLHVSEQNGRAITSSNLEF